MAKKRRVSKRAEASESSNMPLIIGGAVALLFIVGLGTLLYLSLQPEEVIQIEGVEVFGNLPREHNEAVSYVGEEIPPPGGVHSPAWQNCGIYDEPILAKNAIHSLEHGAVWISYNPNLSEDQVDILKDAVGNQSFLLLSPWEDQASPIVMSAWGIQLQLEDASDERVELFIDEYRLGRQTPEPNAACTGGVGAPTG